MTAQVWDREDDFLAFPLPGLSLPGGTHGGTTFSLSPCRPVIPELLSPAIKTISQMWGSSNSDNQESSVLGLKSPWLPAIEGTLLTLLGRVQPSCWPTLPMCSVTHRDSFCSPDYFPRPLKGEDARPKPRLKPGCILLLPGPYCVRGNDLDSFVLSIFLNEAVYQDGLESSASQIFVVNGQCVILSTFHRVTWGSLRISSMQFARMWLTVYTWQPWAHLYPIYGDMPIDHALGHHGNGKL